MSQGSKHYVIPVFIPMSGCPFSCYFCNQHQITGQQSLPSKAEVQQIIEQHLASFPKKGIVELAFFGGSFTGLPADTMEKYLSWVQDYLKSGRINAVRISTRPDYISAEILDLLAAYHVKTIELGAQSMNNEVLRQSGRGHSAEDTIRACKLIAERGFVPGLQMMCGLPGDSPETCLNTAKDIIAAGAKETRIYPALVIKGTHLEQLYRQGKYSPLTTSEAVAIIASLIPLFESAGVKILRIGLHPSEGLSEETIVAGPEQTGLREKALSKIWGELLSPLMQHKGNQLCIRVHPSQLNFASGYHQQNRRMLEEAFSNVKFSPDSHLHEREYTFDIS